MLHKMEEECRHMSKIMALDLGDQWIGVALTDLSGMFARPLTTVPALELETFLAKTSKTEPIELIVVGYPKTMKGGESEQTLKVIAQKQKLEKQFPELAFVFWDERLSSQRAQQIGLRQTGQRHKGKSKEDKLKEHAVAAAFILDSYISFKKAAQEQMSN